MVKIKITDTELIGNGANMILSSNAISLSNVTVANSTSTGLTLERSLVTIENNLIFKNNTGVVGGGLAINDSSQLILMSSANLEFIDNHASIKVEGSMLNRHQLNDTDTQCVDNRGHRMCGSCTEGYSLLTGSNKCGQCHDNYMMITWIALFAVMGILLVVLLIALNLTVSVGTLNGLLFYANIVKLYEPVFSRKGALPVLSHVISWINLDIWV
uniref:Right handed beta helix domain-containing protein n=1 Tax=Amphimedon queenslandica TaxID=400682 RepID=A0A1X7T312_AMPQE